MTRKPWLSGHCGHDNPPEIHAQCKGAAAGKGDTILECSCFCHMAPDPVPAAPLSDIGVPGFHADIDEEAYHRDPSSLSHSGAKTLLKAPAIFRYEQQHPVYKKVFEFGSAAHAKVLGVGVEVRVIPDDLLAKNGAASTTEAKAFIEDARAAGAVVLKPAEAQQIDDMADELSRHSFAMELFSEGQPEVSAYAPDKETGVMRRCRFDWLNPWTLVDYKALDSCDPDVFGWKAADYGYHIQHAWYLDMARELGHPADSFTFVIQMKRPPYLVTVVELKHRSVERGRELSRRALQIYRDCVEVDVWPGYVPETDFARVQIPERALKDYETEIAS